MKSDSGRTTSYWQENAAKPGSGLESLRDLDVRRSLDNVDVCIVGAGIAGLSTAYLLARAGRRVVVLDDGPIGGGETGRTTAHLSNVLDDRFTEMERLHGARGARLAAESHGAAIDTIARIVAAEQIDCDFERLDGYLHAEGAGPQALRRELDAARRAGLDPEWLDRSPLGAFVGPALRFPDQGQFHPLRYLEGLAAATVRRGGRIFADDPAAHVVEIRRGSPAQVVTRSGHTITADAVVIATNSPIDVGVEIHTKQAPYRTYAIGVRVPAGSIPRALCWDMADPYHYARVQPARPGEPDDVLIVGGEDHKTGEGAAAYERFARLFAWARARFPGVERVDWNWSGQVMEPIDGLAFIGSEEPGSNVYVVSGDSGMGMTHGTIAALVLSDRIAGHDNPWAALYDPRRTSLRGAGEFLRENADNARRFVTDLVSGGDADGASRIAPGTGAIIRKGLRKYAVYRDHSGRLTVLSAVCTHMGCTVTWNPDENTWDCPCHGSRFDAEGDVVNGPAVSGLAAAGEEDLGKSA